MSRNIVQIAKYVPTDGVAAVSAYAQYTRDDNVISNDRKIKYNETMLFGRRRPNVVPRRSHASIL